MSTETQAIGSGVYILSVTWLISIFVCILSIRVGRLIGIVALLAAAAITSLLILIPRTSFDARSADIVYDKLFILRLSVLIVIIISVIGGVGFFFAYYCTAPIETKKLRHWAQ